MGGSGQSAVGSWQLAVGSWRINVGVLFIYRTASDCRLGTADCELRTGTKFSFGYTSAVTEGQRSFAMSVIKINWYAVHTRPRWEKKVASLLDGMGVNHYCPLNKVKRQWSDRKKIVLEPLFKGYVFVQIPENIKWELLKVNGVVNYVHWLGKPAKIRESEIEIIRKFLHEFDDVEVTETRLTVKANVRIKQGVLMNFKGLVLELIGNKARVRIDSMGMQLSAVFEKKNLEILPY